MTISKKYFGTDGIRGKVGQYPITPDFVLRLGYAVGKILLQQDQHAQVIIGKDTRLSGYLFESSLEAGFCYAGVDVLMAGPIPTPAIAFLTKALRLSAGVVISASHNFYSDNGIKFFNPHGMKFNDEIELQIEIELEQAMIMGSKIGKVYRLNDASGRYIEYCKNKFTNEMNLSSLNIVLDCANGATYQIAPKVFRELRANVITTGCNPNGENINSNCGSTYPQHLINVMQEYPMADIGIAYDGDGDRVIMIDKLGNIYNGDKLLYIIMLLYKKLGIEIKTIIGTVMSNLSLERALQVHGINFIRAKVGDRYVLEELKKHNAIIGGEPSGHIICIDKHSSGDGIIVSLLVLASMLKYNKTLKELIDWVEYPQVLLNIELTAENAINWKTIIEPAVQLAQQRLGDNGRIIVRKSGTESLIRIMVEANSKELAYELTQNIAKDIRPI